MISITKQLKMAPRAALAALAISMGACATLTGSSAVSEVTKQIIYKKNLMVALDGEKGARGVYVTPRKPSATLVIETPQKPKVLKITTCHREEVIVDPGKRFTYNYRPAPLEQGYCLLEIAAFDEKGENDWALIDFREGETLPAEVACSGQSYSAIGVSLCQARTGLIQSLTFQEPTAVVADQECPIEEADDHKTFTYTMNPDKCLYVFYSLKNKEVHRHTSFGYTEVRIDL